jgi:DUF971 family protein
MNPFPTKIEPLNDREMLLEWKEGGKFSVPYFEIRFDCPCAVCIDEHTGQKVLKRENVRPDIRVTGAEVVGRYAVQLKWNDGHGTGIYHFDRLFDLCQRHGKPIAG